MNVKDQDNSEEKTRAFNLEEENWNIAVDRLSAEKMRKPERNLHIGLIAKLVSCEKIFEPVVGRTYLDRKSIVVARKSATLEAKKMPEQKEKEAKHMEESKRWDG